MWTVDLDQWSARGVDPASVGAEDRSQAERVRSAVAGSRLLARRSVTRTVLAGMLGVDVGELVMARLCPTCGSTEHGRPSIPGDPVSFSVSASQGLAVVVASSDAVGVDVEIVPATGMAIPVGLSDGERARVEALPLGDRPLAIARLWTAKEAVLKAGGRTLADDPGTVDAAVMLDTDAGSISDADRIWRVRRLYVSHSSGTTGLATVADRSGADLVFEALP
jgi:4'-phosphopantetheinyl transferase